MTRPKILQAVEPAASNLPTLPTMSNRPAEPPVDVVRLADRVYDLLMRRLAAERERRGW